MVVKIRNIFVAIFIMAGGFWWFYSVYVGLNRPTHPIPSLGLVHVHRVHRELIYISFLEDIALRASAYLAILSFFILAFLTWKQRTLRK